jgi:GAF domain-containing protein
MHPEERPRRPVGAGTRAFIVSDVRVGSAVKHKQAHVDRGIRSIAALPLIIAGKALATFELHAAQVGFFDDDEMNCWSSWRPISRLPWSISRRKKRSRG